MMYRDIWNKSFLNLFNKLFKSARSKNWLGTGFKIGNHLVTNNYVFAAPGSHHVELRFINNDRNSTRASKVMTYADFQTRLETVLPENSWDFAILKPNDIGFDLIPSLTLADSNKICIG